MNTITPGTVIGALVALSLAANAVMAQQAGAGKPQQEFKGPVKVFILAGQSNMEGHAGIQTLDRWGEHPTHGYLLKKIKKADGSFVVRESEYKSVKPEDLTSAMRAFFEKLKPQIEKAAETKVRLAIENHGDALLNSPDSFKAFIDLNPAPQHVGLGIAPYHLQNIKVPVDEVIRLAGSQPLFFYAWQAAGGMKQLPGHGPADYVPWLRALARINYQGFVNPFMHGHPKPEELSAGLTQSCTYLKDCHQKATA